MTQEQKESTIRMKDSGSDVVEIDLVELFSYFLSKIWFIIAGFLIGAVLAGVITYFFIKPLYTGTAKLYMVSSSKGSVVDISDLNIGTSLSSDYEQLVKTRPIIESVIEKMDLPYDYDQMMEMLSVSTISNTRILVLKFTSQDPTEAKEVTNALAEEAVTRLPSVMDTPEPHIAEEAIIPEHRSSPSYSKNILISALVGMLLVMGVLTLLFVLDDTLDTADDVEKFFGVKPLTVVPESDIGVLNEALEKKDRRFRKKKKNNKEAAS
ncbi:MAG: capsular polysaccharide biosynthesis protein [Lachnospiraceae bacterium]|nr:capsular polysaccharide biosynthesis protein [Lachnospiraceae bacterium]